MPATLMLLALLLVGADAWSAPVLHAARPAVRTASRSPAVTAVADPFASPVFLDAGAGAAAVPPGQIDFTELAIAYVVLMVALNGWDYYVLPKLQDAGLMPELRPGLGSLRAIRKAKEEIFNVPWKTPLTIDRAARLPSLAELQKDAYRVGVSITESNIRVYQYIRAHAQDAAAEAGSKVLMELAASEDKRKSKLLPIKARRERGMTISDELGICQVSEDFSKFYGHRVYICKRQA